MFRPAFGVVERILLRRFCSQTAATAAAVPQSKPAGVRLLHQHVRLSKPTHTRSHVGAAAATAAGRHFSFFRKNYKSQAVAIVALSTVSVGLGYMSKKLHSPEIDWVEVGVDLNPSKIESVEADVSSENLGTPEIDWVEVGVDLHPSKIESVEADVSSENLGTPEIDPVEAGVISKSFRPSEIDWVEAGVVSPVVRNQKKCGSCWAMAVVASVEALHYLNTEETITLSPQELLDCNKTNNGCKGGNCTLALQYLVKNGISTESSYPYKAQRNIIGCKPNKTAAARISDFRPVELTEDALEEAVAKQPVIVSLQNTADLRRYKGGIMEYEALPKTLPDGNAVRGHAVLIVGYGITNNGIKYWRFKNSWGETWGEGGYGRIRRHVADERGVLGMFTRSAVYPVLNT